VDRTSGWLYWQPGLYFIMWFCCQITHVKRPRICVCYELEHLGKYNTLMATGRIEDFLLSTGSGTRSHTVPRCEAELYWWIKGCF